MNFKRFYSMLLIGSGLAMSHSVAIAQQAQQAIFDDPLPNIEDNLPPESMRKQMFEENMAVLQSTEPVAQPLLSQAMLPFNPRRAEFIELFQRPISAVVFQGQSVPLKSPKLVQLFYQQQDFPMIWTHEDAPTALLIALRGVIASAEDDALPPARYHQSAIETALQYQILAEPFALEILATDAYLTLASDLANGLVDPRKTHPEWVAEKMSDVELTVLLAQAVLNNDLATGLDELNAYNLRYQQLKRRYLASKRHNATTAPALANVVLREGMTHPAVLQLRQHLGVEGDAYFDAELTQAVKAFQRSVGSKADGIVGAGTRARLNGGHTSSDNPDKLKINMERLRWLPQELGERYILVNIPSFRVKVYDNQEVIYNTRAIVGRKDRRTPAFTDKMRHVVMSPTWTVPPTIMRKDKLPQLRANPAAFDGSYEAIVGGRAVAPSSVNWHASNAASYTLRQKPGNNNALGRVKFLFPNSHAIYLHDTPNKSLFNKEVRALSSGCVRINDPQGFAEILLSNSQWNSDKIKKAMNRSSELWANPSEELPIYLVYWTMWGEFDGSIQKARDIYELDNALLKQYNAAL